MNIKKYILPLTIVAIVALASWLFLKVLIYLVISLVLFLIGYPLTSTLEKIKIKGKPMNDGLASLITLMAIFSVFGLFFFLIVPPLIQQIEFMSELNFYDVVNQIIQQFPSLQALTAKLGDRGALNSAINEQLNQVFNFDTISLVINNIFDYTSAILGGLFCVLFITFFLLKDQNTVSRTFLLLTPQRYEDEMKDILRTSKRMLSKYFSGLIIDVLIVGTLAGLLMWILGIKNALIIGFIAGLFNVIPYIGPFITLLLALFLGVSGCIEAGQYDLIQSTITKIIIALLSINIIDAVFLQPYIFSNTVKAHPLEIFLVILMAGTLAGIGGMVVAIPVYTLIRIVAKEFLTQFRFFRKITEKID